MVKKGDVKSVALVVAGVFVAGLFMSQFRQIPIVAKAIDGYDA